MHDYDWLLLAAFSLLVLAPAPFLGRYFYRVMEGQRTWLSPVLQPLERQAKARGFLLERRTVELEGLCPRCQERAAGERP